jgi:acetyl-CoA carboxylase biotin carboxyl carrier protein
MNQIALFEPEALKEIGEWLHAADVDAMEMAWRDRRVCLVRTQAGYAATSELPSASVMPPAANAVKTVAASASMAGVFLDRHPWSAKPLAHAGKRVQKGELICILQIGLLLVGVASPESGVVYRLPVASGTIVGFGTALVDIELDVS